MNTLVIVNPKSAGGGTAGRIESLKRAVSDAVQGKLTFTVTTHAGHATELARTTDADQIAVVGGDGTVHEVVNGLAHRSVDDRPILGLLPAGTGSDLARTLKIPNSLTEAVAILRDGEVRVCDWTQVRVAGQTRISINVAGFGLSGEVVKSVNAGKKAFGGKLSFGLATVRALWSWPAPDVRIQWSGPDGTGEWTGPLASAFIGNGSFCGGGMWIAPDGAIDDGLLDLVIVPDQSVLTSARWLPYLYNGRIEEVPYVVRASVHSLTAEALTRIPVRLDLDGEQPGQLPVEMTVEPGAIRLRGRWR